MESTEPMIEEQLKLAGEGAVIIQAVTDFLGRYPDKFRKYPYTTFGKYYEDSNISILIKAYFDFDAWVKQYIIESIPEDRKTLFCAEMRGDAKGDGEIKIRTVFLAEDSDGGLGLIRETVKALDMAK